MLVLQHTLDSSHPLDLVRSATLCGLARGSSLEDFVWCCRGRDFAGPVVDFGDVFVEIRPRAATGAGALVKVRPGQGLATGSV